MFFKHILFAIVFNVFLFINGLMPDPSSKTTTQLADTLLELNPYLNTTIVEKPPKCVQTLCKFVCFNGTASEIDKDIHIVSNRNNHFCPIVEELRLYNYKFFNDSLHYGFLGNYTEKVVTLYLASSKITDIEAGAFAKGTCRTIFGWKEISRNLKTYAKNNEWHCSCDMQRELKGIFEHHKITLLCIETKWFREWSVFKEGSCGVSSLENSTNTELNAASDLKDLYNMTTTKRNETLSHIDTTEGGLTTGTGHNKNKENPVKLYCKINAINISERIIKPIPWPLIDFNIVLQSNLRVNIVVTAPANLDGYFGLIWFRKVTTQYYKMEINYNDYGLGCYNAISFVTTVDSLSPNTAYTFCVVKNILKTTSPFSCKSIYVSGSNLAMQDSVWLSRDKTIIYISLIVFGIIIFSVAGILIIYLILKRKPILLKGIKRVTTLYRNSSGIVVLPKENSLKMIKEKEEKLVRIASPIRRKSIESVASSQSYINTNLYEVIPAYNKLKNQALSAEVIKETVYTTGNQDAENCYLTPFATVSSTANIVQYAEIPCRVKRLSNDALPELPSDQAPLSLAVNESCNKPVYTHVGRFYVLDSQV